MSHRALPVTRLPSTLLGSAGSSDSVGADSDAGAQRGAGPGLPNPGGRAAGPARHAAGPTGGALGQGVADVRPMQVGGAGSTHAAADTARLMLHPGLPAFAASGQCAPAVEPQPSGHATPTRAGSPALAVAPPGFKMHTRTDCAKSRGRTRNPGAQVRRRLPAHADDPPTTTTVERLVRRHRWSRPRSGATPGCADPDVDPTAWPLEPGHLPGPASVRAAKWVSTPEVVSPGQCAAAALREGCYCRS